MKNKSAIEHDKHIAYIALATAAILLIPFAAMRFSDEVQWGALDFVTIGALLFSTGLAYELLSRRIHKTGYRIAMGAVLFIALLVVWVELAVGIFD